jgi:hypothetical protein
MKICEGCGMAVAPVDLNEIVDWYIRNCTYIKLRY